MTSSNILYSVLHVPKCAGTALQYHFLSNLDPTQLCRLNKRRDLAEFMAQPPTVSAAQHMVVVTGHRLTRDVEQTVAGPRPVRRVALLRDPLSLFVSHYNFRMMRYLDAGQGIYPIELAMKARVSNFITHFILRNYLRISGIRWLLMPDSEKYRTINALFGQFWYVADYRRCGELTQLLGNELGIPGELAAKNTAKQWSHKTGFTPVRIEDLSEEFVTEFRRRNAVDDLIYRSWSGAGLHTASTQPPDWPAGPASRNWRSEFGRPYFQLRRRMLRDLWHRHQQSCD